MKKEFTDLFKTHPIFRVLLQNPIKNPRAEKQRNRNEEVERILINSQI